MIVSSQSRTNTIINPGVCRISLDRVGKYRVSQEPIQSLTCDGLDLFLVCKKYRVSQEPIQSLTPSKSVFLFSTGSGYRVSQEPIQSLTVAILYRGKISVLSIGLVKNQYNH